MMQMMTGGQFPPGPLPTEFNLSPPANPPGPPTLDNGLNPGLIARLVGLREYVATVQSFPSVTIYRVPERIIKAIL